MTYDAEVQVAMTTIRNDHERIKFFIDNWEPAPLHVKPIQVYVPGDQPRIFGDEAGARRTVDPLLP